MWGFLWNFALIKRSSIKERNEKKGVNKKIEKDSINYRKVTTLLPVLLVSIFYCFPIFYVAKSYNEERGNRGKFAYSTYFIFIEYIFHHVLIYFLIYTCRIEFFR